MYAQIEKPKENKNRVVGDQISQKKSNKVLDQSSIDNRSESIAQLKLLSIVNDDSLDKGAASQRISVEENPNKTMQQKVTLQCKHDHDLNMELENYLGKGDSDKILIQKKAINGFTSTILSNPIREVVLQAAWRHDGGQYPNDIYTWTGSAPNDLLGIWSDVTYLHINNIDGNIHIKLVYQNSNGHHDFYYYHSSGSYKLLYPDGSEKNGYPTGYSSIDSVFSAIRDLLNDWMDE